MAKRATIGQGVEVAEATQHTRDAWPGRREDGMAAPHGDVDHPLRGES